MSYSIHIESTALKTLGKIPKTDRNRIISAIDALADNPRPFGAIKLKNTEAWRIRVGNYRVIYEIENKVFHILVVNIDHRKNVYRDL